MRTVRNQKKCPLTFALGIIGGKWKPIIIYNLSKTPKRFGQLDALIPGISRKVLTKQLEELVEDGIVIRTAFAETPPRVEYQLTKSGVDLIPLLDQLGKWGKTEMKKSA
ncbi:MAG: helix-turn-helix domain-containing protein [Cytophagaceae bacterium]